jgi:hypothetical protein
VTVVAPTRGLWGTASIGGRSIYLELSGEGAFHKVGYKVSSSSCHLLVLGTNCRLRGARVNSCHFMRHV